ncbi:MAG: hypothetical protein M1826_004219 [Phylliscum demangeonii]|nr:MAG: hypothetical protein M1826_004219 [Phylliscum demangeonii]
MTSKAHPGAFPCTFKSCKATFRSPEQLRAHKINSPEHDYCNTCNLEFEDEEAYRIHRIESDRHMHLTKQNLRCVGCGEMFPRAGSLVSHVEGNACPVITLQQFQAQRAHKHLVKAFLEDPEAFKLPRELENKLAQAAPRKEQPSLLDTDFDRAADSGGPPADNSRANVPWPKINEWLENTETGKPPTSGAEDDLLDVTSFGALSIAADDETTKSSTGSEASGVLVGNANEDTVKMSPAPEHRGAWNKNADEGTDKTSPAPEDPGEVKGNEDEEAAPKLAVLEDPSKSSGKAEEKMTPTPAVLAELSGNADDKTTQVPAAPGNLAVKRALPELFKTVSEIKQEIVEAWDPRSKAFRPHAFLHPVTGKYICPHPYCRTAIKSVQGFRQHLLSAAHLPERIICPACYKNFNSTTALIQHCESPSNKCQIRHSTDYDRTLDVMTGGLIETRGYHPDGTVKYVANDVEW